jgi:hypothetical protein
MVDETVEHDRHGQPTGGNHQRRARAHDAMKQPRHVISPPAQGTSARPTATGRHTAGRRAYGVVAAVSGNASAASFAHTSASRTPHDLLTHEWLRLVPPWLDARLAARYVARSSSSRGDVSSDDFLSAITP